MGQQSIAIVCAAGMAQLETMKARTENTDRTLCVRAAFLSGMCINVLPGKCDVDVTEWYCITKLLTCICIAARSQYYQEIDINGQKRYYDEP